MQSPGQRIIHIICFSGSCSLHFGGQDYNLTHGMCLVAVDIHVHFISPSPDCEIKVLYLSPNEHATLMPATPWGVCGEFHFFSHPLFTVNDEVLAVLRKDIEQIEQRSVPQPDEYSTFARNKAIEIFYLDLVKAHEKIFCNLPVSKNYASIMNRFISLLKGGEFTRNRTVGHFADLLTITSKHLHKVCTEVSGHAPSYWIQRFTIMQAKFLLRHEKKTQKEIAAILGFDNVSHFNRYISNIEGTTPGKIK